MRSASSITACCGPPRLPRRVSTAETECLHRISIKLASPRLGRDMQTPSSSGQADSALSRHIAPYQPAGQAMHLSAKSRSSPVEFGLCSNPKASLPAWTTYGTRSFPVAKLTNRDEFCNMVRVQTAKNWILTDFEVHVHRPNDSEIRHSYRHSSSLTARSAEPVRAADAFSSTRTRRQPEVSNGLHSQPLDQTCGFATARNSRTDCQERIGVVKRRMASIAAVTKLADGHKSASL